MAASTLFFSWEAFAFALEAALGAFDTLALERVLPVAPWTTAPGALPPTRLPPTRLPPVRLPPVRLPRPAEAVLPARPRMADAPEAGFVFAEILLAVAALAKGFPTPGRPAARPPGRVLPGFNPADLLLSATDVRPVAPAARARAALGLPLAALVSVGFPLTDLVSAALVAVFPPGFSVFLLAPTVRPVAGFAGDGRTGMAAVEETDARRRRCCRKGRVWTQR